MNTKKQSLTYENFIGEFLDKFPELKSYTKRQMKWLHGEYQEDPVIYVFWGNVMFEFLPKALKTMKEPALLKKLFAFFERMSTSSDEKLHDLLMTETLEYLGDDRVILEKARELMGKDTLKLSYKIEKLWGRE